MLSDQEFFGKELQLELPGMEAVKSAVSQQDYKAARAAYAAYLRTHLQPERFFTLPYQAPGNDFTLQGEDEMTAAERISRNEIVSCGTPYAFGDRIDWRYNATENGYPEWPWQLNRHNDWKLLAHVYRQTGDETYAACCADQFESWFKQSAEPEYTPVSTCWRTIECGIRMGENWPYTLHAFFKSPHFTDDVLVDWVKSVAEHGHILRTQHKQGNWLIMEMNGLANIGILFPELTQAEAWREYAFQKMSEELSIQVYPDGFQYELSTNYHEVVVGRYYDLTKLAKAYDIPVPENFMTSLEHTLEVYVKLAMPDGRLPDLNDGSKAKAAGFVAPKMDFFPDRKDFQWLISDGEKGQQPEYTSVELPYSGFLVMRESWDKDACWAIFDAAPFGKGHQHEDKLSLTLFSHGKLLVTEGGNYAYDDSEIRRYVLSTRSHNTIRVDGMDQNRRADYHWEKEDIRKHSGIKCRITPEYDFGEGVYEEGYGPEKLAVRHCRRVIFVKQPKYGLHPFFLVIDRLCAEEPHHYEVLWHFDTEEVCSSKGKTSMDGLHVLYSEGITRTELVTGQTFPEWQGWVADSFLQGDYRTIPTLKCLADGANIRVVTLLYPYEEEKTVSVSASSDVHETEITLRLADGSVWTLDETNL